MLLVFEMLRFMETEVWAGCRHDSLCALAFKIRLVSTKITSSRFCAVLAEVSKKGRQFSPAKSTPSL